MKVVYCQQPNQFLEREEEKPVPKEGEALLQIKRIGICGTDIHAFYGNQPYFTYPRVLGHELSAEIVEINGESEFQLGDYVTIVPYMECGSCVACRNGKPNCCVSLQVLGVHTDGGMKEFLAVPLSHLVKVNDISLDAAALIEPLSIGAHAVRRAEVKEREQVLVIGAGPIGLAVMKFAALAGAKVIAMDINPERLRFCQQWAGVDHVIQGGKDALSELQRLTNGDGAWTVIDATGNQHSMNEAIQYVSHGGKLVFVGLIKESVSFHHPDMHKREMTVIGSRNATRADFEYVISCMEKDLINCEALLTKRLKLTEVAQQFTEAIDPRTNVIKVIVETE
ncbi:zinc-binding alcohol dehydrogenase family protein [Alkalihalobacillus oceani]|uniref:zinc-binding alcohol dehydrogenase family protein n=1 Tax=Halalkalibacter oceani TaxID=1653776 RepID=UPI00203DEDDB|nr:zinc-binding alcohol dehydrogenase family protein [Halalkalibacter oceani]MCM3761117.1 zinc-binding alcohol dehydrogenase family protein [Halalkalibacter oceani]